MTFSSLKMTTKLRVCFLLAVDHVWLSVDGGLQHRTCFIEANKQKKVSQQDGCYSFVQHEHTHDIRYIPSPLPYSFSWQVMGKTLYKGWLQELGIIGLSSIEVMCFLLSFGYEHLALAIFHWGQLGGKSCPRKRSRVRWEPGCDRVTLSVSSWYILGKFVMNQVICTHTLKYAHHVLLEETTKP